MEGMFSANTSLKSIDVSNFDMRNVIDITSMFYYCDSLELGNFNSEKTEEMSMLFMDCKNLRRIHMQSFNTERVLIWIICLMDVPN